MTLALVLLLPSLASSQNVADRLENSSQWSKAAASAGSLRDASVLASRAMEGSLVVSPPAADGRGASPAKTFAYTPAPKTVEGRPVPPPDAKEGEKPEEEPGALSTFKDAFLGIFITPFMMGVALGSAGGVLGGTKFGTAGIIGGAFLGIVVGLVVGAVLGAWGFVKGLFSGLGKLVRGKL